MKKQLLALTLFMMSIGLFSQSIIWKPENSNLDTAWGTRWISVVDSNSAWAIGEDGWAASTSIKFTRTQNGTTFVPGTFLPDTLYYASANISAVNDSVAYIPCYSKDATRNGIIMKTMNRGVSWTNVADTSFMFVGSNNFPDWAHFYDNNRGIVMGDPNGGNFEIYHTYNGGTTWTRVPNGNIDLPTSGEYGVTDVLTWYGKKHLWFGTNHGGSNAVEHVYRSNDTGHTWQSAQIPGLLAGVSGLSFRDSLNGLAWGNPSSTGKTIVKRTNDGGITWTTVIQHNNVGTYAISSVPGRNAFLSVGLDSLGTAYLTSVTYDDGGTWTVLESGITSDVRMLKVTMLDSAHGWAGCFSDNTNVPFGSNGMDKWMGPVIPFSCPMSVTGVANICSGSTTTLTAQGANNYTWTPGSINTNTISVSPNTTTVYTVSGVAAAGCSNSTVFTLSVTPTPTVGVTSALTTICSGSKDTLRGTGATTYSWSPIGSITGTGATVVAHPTVTTTYTLTGHNGTCTGTNTVAVTVTANTTTVAVTSSVISDTLYGPSCSTTPTSTSLTATGATTFSWTPSAGLSATSGASVTASPTVTTTYTATGTMGNCVGTKTIKIVVKSCIGINQLSVNGTQVSFYPNPNNGMVTVSLTNIKAGTNLTVSDLLGNEVYRTSVNSNSLNQNINLDLTDLPKGLYLFGVSNGNQSKVQKLIIQ